MTVTTSVRLPAVHPFLGLDIAHLIEARGRQLADRELLIWEPFDGPPRRWTYGRFAQDALRVAAGLRAAGVGVGDVVLVHLENCPEILLVWAACARLGAVAARVNSRLTEAELRGVAELCQPVGVITQAELAGVRAEHLPGIRWAVRVVPGSAKLPALLDGDPAEVALRAPDPGLPLSLQFTSGTSGRPKAALWTHANELWGAKVSAAHERLGVADTHLVHMPLYHTVAHSWQFLAALWSGARIVLQPRFSASRFWDVSTRNGCTWTWTVPFHLRALAGRARPDQSAYRYWGAAVCGPRADSRFGVTTIGAMGMTEVITQFIMADLFAPNHRYAIGRPVPEYGLAIVDEKGRSVTSGETGRLLVRGVRGLSLFAEYHGDPGATGAAFPEKDLLATGDTVTLLGDGCIRFADRASDMIKVGGENVSPAEVETVLRDVEGIADVAVVAAPDPMLDEVPVAVLVLASDNSPDRLVPEALARCRRLLADFKVPRTVYLTSRLPRRTLGKVAKAELRALIRAGVTGSWTEGWTMQGTRLLRWK
jgi:crotonobetaine/carnitine-CoA ligase